VGSDDKLLECYVQIPSQKLFKAQEQFAAELGCILDAGNQKHRKESSPDGTPEGFGGGGR
jgi:hypothetical protein